MAISLLHTPEGVRDLYNEECAKKETVSAKIGAVFHRFGYRSIQTPSYEFFDIFNKDRGSVASNQMFKFFDRDGNTLVLRPDITPSIARCAAKYFMDETAPLRFTYSGSTFTNTSNLQGKLKEVTQMGAELMLEPSVEADAEMISLVVEALKNCGLTDLQITVGEVEYFKGICAQAGLNEEVELKLRDFISAKNYFGAQELLEEQRVRKDYAQVLLGLADLVKGTQDLESAKMQVDNERSLQAIERLEALYEVLKKYGTEKYVSFDLGLLNQYNYYTGVIFKGYTYGVGDAIVTGGRYDKLLSYFGKNAPAIGFVVVVDDVLEALSRQNKKPHTGLDGCLLFYTPDSYDAALKKANQLRLSRVSAELIPVSGKQDCRRADLRGRLRREAMLIHADGSCEQLKS